MTRDDLAASPPSDFVRARAALVKELRAAGDREAAAEVAKLRRPPKSLWAVNALARRDRDDVKGLLAAGAGLRAAHERAVVRGEAAPLREAEAELRARVAVLVDSARALLSGASEAMLRRVSETLRAAATGGDDLRRALREGRLEHEPEPTSGFDLEGVELPARRPRASANAEKVQKKPKDDARERQRREALARKAEKLRARARELGEQARQAEEAALRSI